MELSRLKISISAENDVFFPEWKDMDGGVFERWSINHGLKRYSLKCTYFKFKTQ